MDLGSTFDEIQRLFASRVPETDHENGPTFPWVSIAVLARMEKVTSVLIHSRPCRAHRDSRATCCDHHVGGPPSALARKSFPTSRPPAPLDALSHRSAAGGRSAPDRAPGTRQPDLERDNAANSWALAGRAMPRSPLECADVDGHSAGATMPRRRPRLLRFRTPCPACEAQPQSPDQQRKPRLPESR